ncbi:MAG: DUF488 domain-containing protein [Balneolales bacterium]
MFYRRKIILALLQKFGGDLKATSLQKLLLMLTLQQVKPAYDFVPYKYGAYSFQARADQSTMIKYGLLKDSRDWVLTEKKDYLESLRKADIKILDDLYRQFKHYTPKNLIRHTYLEYPFYAINSIIANKHLSEEELRRLELFRPTNKVQKLYTIGYEGISAETYMNKLIRKDIRLLVDVRKNSFSMKYGFSKKQLKSMCEKLNIQFMHIPELGIESEKRKSLDSMEDYNLLFQEYEDQTLPTRQGYLESLKTLIDTHKRIAITCFEKEHTSCHRHKISDYIQKEYSMPVEHL